MNRKEDLEFKKWKKSHKLDESSFLDGEEEPVQTVDKTPSEEKPSRKKLISPSKNRPKTSIFPRNLPKKKAKRTIVSRLTILPRKRLPMTRAARKISPAMTRIRKMTVRRTNPVP